MNTSSVSFSKENYQKNLAENLSTLRAKLSLSQQDLADLIGASRQTISLIERGSREMMWDTCMSLTLLFISNDDTRALMPSLGIDIKAMSDSLRIPKKAARDKQHKADNEGVEK